MNPKSMTLFLMTPFKEFQATDQTTDCRSWPGWIVTTTAASPRVGASIVVRKRARSFGRAFRGNGMIVYDLSFAPESGERKSSRE